jgi:hypothetical protein
MRPVSLSSIWAVLADEKGCVGICLVSDLGLLSLLHLLDAPADVDVPGGLRHFRTMLPFS